MSIITLSTLLDEENGGSKNHLCNISQNIYRGALSCLLYITFVIFHCISSTTWIYFYVLSNSCRFDCHSSLFWELL